MAKSPTMPSMPTISDSPKMPSISAPTFGGKFYTPGNNLIVSSNNPTKSSNLSKEEVQSTSKTNSLDSMFNTSQKTNNTLANSYLTAEDVTTLEKNGLLNNIYGLLGNSSQSSSLSSTSNTELMLNKIINQLDLLKKEQEKKNSETESNNKKNVSIYTQPEKTQHPAILRFLINGYNILDTCKTVHFSKQENDGSFLLTADRKYLSEETTRNETFYLLFKSNGNGGSSKGYEVVPSVIQDYQNKNSLTYQLAQKKELKASKTGNLVVLRSTSPDWNLDLLLDIGE